MEVRIALQGYGPYEGRNFTVDLLSPFPWDNVWKDGWACQEIIVQMKLGQVITPGVRLRAAERWGFTVVKMERSSRFVRWIARHQRFYEFLGLVFQSWWCVEIANLPNQQSPAATAPDHEVLVVDLVPLVEAAKWTARHMDYWKRSERRPNLPADMKLPKERHLLEVLAVAYGVRGTFKIVSAKPDAFILDDLRRRQVKVSFPQEDLEVLVQAARIAIELYDAQAQNPIPGVFSELRIQAVKQVVACYDTTPTPATP